MKIETLCRKAGERFGLNFVPSEEFDGNDGGIWVRDDICTERTDYYNYADSTMDEDNVLNKFMKKHGFFAEPYDSETIFFWKI